MVYLCIDYSFLLIIKPIFYKGLSSWKCFFNIGILFILISLYESQIKKAPKFGTFYH